MLSLKLLICTSSFCREKNKLKYQKLEPPSLDQVKPSAELELSENGAEVEDQQTESSPLEQAWLKAGSVDAQSGLFPQVEVDALCDIGDQLGKNDWNFNGNPCDQNWRTEKSSEKPGYNNSVICGFSYPDGICHVECIILKGQNLDGILPPSLAKLPYIKDIDLTNNYLHGTIPREWTSLRLNYLCVIVNRLFGTIPEHLGKISTLTYFQPPLAGRREAACKNSPDCTEAIRVADLLYDITVISSGSSDQMIALLLLIR
ncbi:hypothetical protein AgCh_028401 [Apium graveolens]